MSYAFLCQKVSHMFMIFCVASNQWPTLHYSDAIMGAMASLITILTIVYLTVYSGADQRKHQSSASLAFVRGIHRWLVYSPHKWPVMRKMLQFDDVIIISSTFQNTRPQSMTVSSAAPYGTWDNNSIASKGLLLKCPQLCNLVADTNIYCTHNWLWWQ